MLVFASAEAVAGITAGATLAAAAVLACITAWTTNGRQKRDLMAEAERQSDTLSHQREIHDLSDLRALLDEAALALNDAGDAIGMLLEALAADGAPMGQGMEDRLAKCERALVAPLMRLRVRLGRCDPIVTHFDAAHTATARWQLRALSDDTEGIRKEIEEAWFAFGRARDAFFAAAVSRAGTRTVGPFGRHIDLTPDGSGRVGRPTPGRC